jgi:hypothetical protein
MSTILQNVDPIVLFFFSTNCAQFIACRWGNLSTIYKDQFFHKLIWSPWLRTQTFQPVNTSPIEQNRFTSEKNRHLLSMTAVILKNFYFVVNEGRFFFKIK